MDQLLTGMSVAVLVTDGFEQIEYTSPLAALIENDATVTLISDRGRVQARHRDAAGETFEVQLLIRDADPMEFDAVLIPGGKINGNRIRQLPEMQKFLQEADACGKPIAAICHGPWLLAAADIIEQRIVTSHPDLREAVREAGASWVDQEVMVDGNLLTSRRPEDLPIFNRKLVDLLYQHLAGNARNPRDQKARVGVSG